MPNRSMRIDPKLDSYFVRLAKNTDRTVSWHMKQALEGYAELMRWQMEGIEKALAEVRAGHTVPHEKVMAGIKAMVREARKGTKRGHSSRRSSK
jgi:predicted transcriptional regulator